MKTSEKTDDLMPIDDLIAFMAEMDEKYGKLPELAKAQAELAAVIKAQGLELDQ